MQDPWKTIAVAMLVLSAGCAVADEPEPRVEVPDFVDGKADSLASGELEPIRTRNDGMTVWAEPRVLSASTWLFQARVSHTIDSISGRIGDSEVVARQVSARKFEVSLTARQMENNLGEEPLVVTIETTGEKTFHVKMIARARFVETTGSYRLYPWKNIEPIAIGRDRIFRARVTTRGEFDFVAGWNDDDSEPIPTQVDATHWALDWYPGMLAWAAHPTEDALYLVGDYEGTRYRRTAPIHMEIVELDVTQSLPGEAWPAPSCEEQVAACMRWHDVDRDDLEECGSWREVSACFDQIDVDDTPEWIERYADDLRASIIDHYGENEADILAAGGNSRPQALLAVDSADIDEVTDAEDVPSGHDLDRHRIFIHPDVVFPGSDIVWFGVYDRTSGELVDVFDFN